jgi:biopolymer transport protein TolR
VWNLLKLLQAAGVYTDMTTGIANRAEINVTPLIDVLLVLLLIFMIITPITSHGVEAQIPQPATGAGEAHDIVVKIDEDRAVTINAEPVSWQALSDRFKEIFARRADKLLFVAAAPRVDFDDVARVIDTARGVGVERVALMPRQAGIPSRTK